MGARAKLNILPIKIQTPKECNIGIWLKLNNPNARMLVMAERKIAELQAASDCGDLYVKME